MPRGDLGSFRRAAADHAFPRLLAKVPRRAGKHLVSHAF